MNRLDAIRQRLTAESLGPARTCQCGGLETWFSRTYCACGSMHTYCTECGYPTRCDLLTTADTDTAGTTLTVAQVSLLLDVVEVARKVIDELSPYWSHGEDCDVWGYASDDRVAIDHPDCDCGAAVLYRMLAEPLAPLLEEEP